MDEIIDKQGWTNDVVLMLLRRWIDETGKTEEATAYLQEVADAEEAG